MTVLTACQSAAKLLKPAQTVPAVIFSSTETFAVELAALVNESAQAIFKAHDWRGLILLNTQAGDGSATAFDMPADYDRMPVKSSVFLTSTQRPMSKIDDLDVWLERTLSGISGVGGEWTLLGSQINIRPAMASTDSARFYYLSNLIVTAEDDTTKSEFTLDTDSFRLPERLLMLDLVWRWRQRKGLDYAEDMQNFEIAKAEAVNRDKGARMLRFGLRRTRGDAAPAYPWTIDA